MSPRGEPDRDRGFTLIEFVMATVLSGIVAGVVIAALATSLNVARATTDQIADSVDTSLISTFLFRDAQAAGGIDPTTARVDPSIGVSTSNTSSGWAGCSQPGDLVVRFSWIDRDTDSPDPTVVVTYALDGGRLTRRVCQDNTEVDVELGNNIATAGATCAPEACGGAAESVSLTFTGSASARPLTHTLTASLRAGATSSTGPIADQSSLVPLVVLGGPSTTTPCPVVTVGEDSPVMVVGDAAIAAECGTAPVGGAPGNLLHPDGLGATRILTGLADPFGTLTAPSTTCEDSALSLTDDLGVTTLYPEPVVYEGSVDLQPGTYVYCDGLTVNSGATVTGTDVFLYVPIGTLTVDPGATVRLDAPRTGPYANLLIWVGTAQQVTLGGPEVSRYGGHIYAPTSDLVVTGAAPTALGGVVAGKVAFSGEGEVRLGLPVPEITITPEAVPGGQVGVAYPVTQLAAVSDNEAAVYTWRASGLPPGITVDAATGTLSGTPSEAGTYDDVVVTVLDETFAARSATFSITIAPELSIDGPAQLPAAQVAVPYLMSDFTKAGGTEPVTWSSTELPPGLALDATTGVLSGTPTVADSFPITVTVTDAMSATASKAYTLEVRAQLAVATATLPGGQVGVTYPPTTLAATGGTPEFTWTATGLPPGLALTPSGELTGTPTTPGTFNVVVQATDAIPTTATAAFSVTVAPELGVGTTELPGGQVGVGYPATDVVPTGGTPPFVWAADGLPYGLTIDSATGTVTGTPTEAGTFPVVVDITDATGTTSTASYSIVIDAALAIAGPETLPAGQVGLAYPSTPIASSGGTGAKTWSALGLPSGLAIDTATGVISGSPTAAGAYTVDVTVTDALSVTASRRYELTVVARLAISTEALPNGTVGVAYPSTTLGGAGGQAPYTWAASGLPNGLTIGASNGVITGTPSAAGSSTVVVSVSDAAGANATRSFAVTVASPVSACPVAPTGWRAEYFGNISLAGTPKICRDDPSINFDWGNGAPADTGLATDNFSVRWTRTQTFAAGTYTFAIGSDDGSRLYIDGVLVFDRWVDQGYPSPVPTVSRALSAGEHEIVMEYYERGGSAKATLTWTSVPPPNPCPVITGWKGEYFNNATLTGPATLCRSDASINFNWGAGSPASTIPADRFSARWTRVVSFTAGTYTFALGSDDGSRLYIDGVLTIDRWSDGAYPNPPPTIDVPLQAGSHTIVVEYYENAGDARATLDWTKQSNGVTATPSVTGDHRWWGDNRINLTNTSTITDMTVTIVVDRTVGVEYAGMWTNFAGDALSLSRKTTTSSITYTFDLKSKKTIPPGAWTLAAQSSGIGFLHPTDGDTWTVVTTSNGVTTTLSGTF